MFVRICCCRKFAIQSPQRHTHSSSTFFGVHQIIKHYCFAVALVSSVFLTFFLYDRKNLIYLYCYPSTCIIFEMCFPNTEATKNSKPRNVMKQNEKYLMKRLRFVVFRCIAEFVSENFPYDRHERWAFLMSLYFCFTLSISSFYPSRCAYIDNNLIRLDTVFYIFKFIV